MVTKHSHFENNLQSAAILKRAINSNKRLLNSEEIEEIATVEIEKTRTHGQPLSLLSIRIDQVKNIEAGKPCGVTSSLSQVAQTCAKLLRSDDFIGKVDETTIIVLLPKTLSKGALHAAERMRTAVSSMNNAIADDNIRRLTISIGIVATRTGRTTYSALRSRADAKREDARGDGGNRINP